LSNNPLFVLSEIKRVLKKDGILLFTTPNLYALHKIIMFNLGMSFNNAYSIFESAKTSGYMGHIREYSNKEILEILKKSGFKIINVDYGNYSNYSNAAFFKKTPLIVLALLAEIVVNLVPRLRQYQIILATK
jgi:SAM-dependent methyltransferase